MITRSHIILAAISLEETVAKPRLHLNSCGACTNSITLARGTDREDSIRTKRQVTEARRLIKSALAHRVGQAAICR